MSTLTEVKKVIGKLTAQERTALTAWLNAQCVTEMSDAEERELLKSLDEAIRDLDAGKGVPVEDVRRMISSWAAK